MINLIDLEKKTFNKTQRISCQNIPQNNEVYAQKISNQKYTK